AWHLLIRGEKRESLIDDFALPAKQSHGAVPAEASVATVLHECWKCGAGGCHLLQVAQRNIAYAEETGAAGITLFAHRLPGFGVNVGPVMVGGGPVQQVAVDVVGREMFERTGH